MEHYEHCLCEVERASADLDAIDPWDLAALQHALEARGAAIGRLSAALIASPRERMGGDVEDRIRAALCKGHCAMVRLVEARRALVVEVVRTQGVGRALRSLLSDDRPANLCTWNG